MQKQEEEEEQEEIERKEGGGVSFFKGIINSLNALVHLCFSPFEDIACLL